MKPTSAPRSFLLGSSIATLLTAPAAFAGNTWDGGGTNNSTLTAANWSPDGVPTGGTAVLTFGGAVRPSVVWDGVNSVAPVNFYGITFAAGAGAFTINNGTRTTFQFTNPGDSSVILNSSSNLQTLKPEVNVFYNGTKTIDGGNSGLALDGGIIFRVDSLTSGQSNKLILTGTADSTTGSIGQAGDFVAASATNTLTKNGSGKWTVTGNATYVGVTTISTGTLEFRGSVSSSGITNNSALVFNNAATQSYANAISGSGTLTKNGAGSLTLSNSNTYTGTTTISGGTLSAGKIVVSGSNSSLGNAASAVTLGAAGSQGTLSYTGNTAAYTRGFTIGGAGGGRLDVTTSGQTLTVQTGHVTGSGPFTVGGAGNTSITSNLTHTGGLTKADAGTLTLSGTNNYSGATVVSGGSLALSGSGSIANSSAITINSSTSLSVTAITGNFTVGASQSLGGSGTLTATGKTVIANGTLTPGNSPGTLTQDGGTLQLGVGGDFNWQVYNANGVAGTGYDTVSLINDATLDLSALSAGNTYNINLWSLSAIGPDANGNAINFNNAVNYAWTLFSTGNTITGFDTSKFTINTGALNGTSGFSNTLDGSFQVALGDSNTDLVLTYTAVPEPGAALLGSLGLIALLRRRRNRAGLCEKI